MKKTNQASQPVFELFRSAQLIRLAMTIIKRADAELGRAFGITQAQYKVLLLIEWHATFSQQQLALELCSTPAAISRLVETLKRKKLIARRANPGNRRENVLTLTTAGKQVLTTSTTLLKKLEKKLYGRVPDQRLQVLSDTLSKLQLALNSK